MIYTFIHVAIYHIFDFDITSKTKIFDHSAKNNIEDFMVPTNRPTQQLIYLIFLFQAGKIYNN